MSWPAVPFSFVPDDPEGPEEKPLVVEGPRRVGNTVYPLELTTACEFRRIFLVQVGQALYKTTPIPFSPRFYVIATFRATHLLDDMLYQIPASYENATGFLTVIRIRLSAKFLHQPWVMFARPGVVQDLPLQGRVTSRVGPMKLVPASTTPDNMRMEVRRLCPADKGDKAEKTEKVPHGVLRRSCLLAKLRTP